MKYLITVFFIACSITCFGQSDTANIRLVFDYINSTEGKAVCQKIVDSLHKQWPGYQTHKSKRRKKTGSSDQQIPFFFSDGYCFVPHKYYLKEDTTKSHNRGHFYDTIANTINYVPHKPCEKKLVSLVVFLADDAIRIEYYEMEMIDSPVKFGMAYSFDFILADDRTVKLKEYNEAQCN